MKYFAHEMSYAEIKEALENLNTVDDNLFELDHIINFYENLDFKKAQKYDSAVLEAPEIAEAFQAALFPLIDLRYIVGQVGSELLDIIAEEHPDWIDKKACDLISS